jgi:lipopolysaccharide export system permease protein
MKLLHRHILANVALTCFAAVGVLAFVLLLANTLRDLLGYILAGQIDATTAVKLIALLVPYAAMYALPMGILTGVLLVLGRMSSDREITAIRSSGVSVAGISAPIFFLALLGCLASLAINFQFMPKTMMTYQRQLAAAVRANPTNFIVEKTFIRDFPDMIVYVGSMRGLDSLQDIWVWQLDKQGRARTMHHVESGTLVFDEEQNALILTGTNVTSDSRDKDNPEAFGKGVNVGHAGQATYVLSLDKLSGSRTVRTKLKWQTYKQLLTEWRRLGRPDPAMDDAERERQQMKVQIVIHEKCAMAFSVISFALIAIPLGIKVSRKETSANLGVALALAMGYYFATIVVGWFDNKPDFRPDLLMWVPNFCFQGLGIWMFYKVDRQ